MRGKNHVCLPRLAHKLKLHFTLECSMCVHKALRLLCREPSRWKVPCVGQCIAMIQSIIYIRPKQKRCCITLCDRPQNLEIYGQLFLNFIFLRFFYRKKCTSIRVFKTEKYQPKEVVKQKKGKISDRPTHVLAP